jgi:hypothetical protein
MVPQMIPAMMLHPIKCSMILLPLYFGRTDAERDDVGSRRLADFRREHIEIASYNRLLAEMRNHINHIHGMVESPEKAIKERQEKKGEAAAGSSISDKTMPS